MLALLIAAAMVGNPQIVDGPNPQLNYFVTQSNINQTICVPNWTKQVRPSAGYTNTLKAKQMMDRHLAGNPKDYEEDHDVPLEAGGHPFHTQNLNPQSWTGDGNAHQKDQVENYVHRSICSGKMTLDQGRSIFLNKQWKQVYQTLQK